MSPVRKMNQTHPSTVFSWLVLPWHLLAVPRELDDAVF